MKPTWQEIIAEAERFAEERQLGPQTVVVCFKRCAEFIAEKEEDKIGQEFLNMLKSVTRRMYDAGDKDKITNTCTGIFESSKDKCIITNIEVGETNIPYQRKCKIVLSNGDRIMFPVSSFDEKKWEEL